MTAPVIPPQSEWPSLTLSQLYDVKINLSDKYYAMRGINASFANQYAKFIEAIEASIKRKEAEIPDD
jgi:hypothetical protein